MYSALIVGDLISNLFFQECPIMAMTMVKTKHCIVDTLKVADTSPVVSFIFVGID